ncbi:longitudinals lacking protein, isoforms H/M/V-like isoform X8 [Macrobrachium nipponense]|uniref:longitudinals lacking protein, isoforms H/M/V-like isoform X8 n=1 Tax=Macrobrachium nipponense TaxID=159736 RepID=UPI0030C8B5BE
MASGLLSLKWNNHRSTFFHVLSTVRSKESYCDVTLACDGKFYPVHKLVLSTCSDYFERMFERTNCKHPIIVLKDIRHEELEALLNYMYVGEVNVLQNELAGLIKAAECLMIKGLAVPDEAPSQTKESKRTYHSSGDSPHAKRRKRDDDGRLSSHNQHLHREGREVSHSQRHSSSASTSTPSSVGRVVPPSSSPSPSVGSASDAVSEECSQSQSETNEAQETSKHPGGEPSSQSKQSVPEVILDEPAVKEEPAEIEEEVTDSKEDVVSQFHFDPLQEGDSRSDPGGGGSGGYDSQMLTSQSQSMEDLVAEALPGSSGLQGNSLWEGEGSLQGFPMEGYSGEGTRPPQMDAKIAEGAVMVCGGGEGGGSTFSKSAFICSICHKPFNHKGNFKKHYRTHTGEKPFLCTKCPYRATQKAHLTAHMLGRHGLYLQSQQQHGHHPPASQSERWVDPPDVTLSDDSSFVSTATSSAFVCGSYEKDS